MKKLISSLLIIAILMNFIVGSTCYAEQDTRPGGPFEAMVNLEGDENKMATPSEGAISGVLEDGEVENKNGRWANGYYIIENGRKCDDRCNYWIFSTVNRCYSFANSNYFINYGFNRCFNFES